MFEGGLGLLLVSASVAIHVEQVQNVPGKEMSSAVLAIKKAIEAKAGEAPAIDKKAGPCRADDKCLAEVRERTGSKDLVLLVISGKAPGLSIDAVRVPAAGERTSVVVDLTGAAARWTKPIEGMIETLWTPPKPVVATGPLGVRVESAKGMPGKEITTLALGIKKALEKETGRKVELDRKAGPCRATEACVAELRGRVAAEDLLFLSIAGSDAAVSLSIERLPPGAAKGKTVSAELPRAADAWDAPVAKLVRDLFGAPAAEPAAPPPVVPPIAVAPPPVTPAPPPAEVAPPKPEAPPPVATAPPPAEIPPEGAAGAVPGAEPDVTAAVTPPVTPEPEEPGKGGVKMLPLIVGGASVAALGVGILFGALSASARNSGMTGSHDPAEIDALNDDVYSRGITANVLFAVAGAGALTAVALFIFD